MSAAYFCHYSDNAVCATVTRPCLAGCSRFRTFSCFIRMCSNTGPRTTLSDADATADDAAVDAAVDVDVTETGGGDHCYVTFEQGCHADETPLRTTARDSDGSGGFTMRPRSASESHQFTPPPTAAIQPFRMSPARRASLQVTSDLLLAVGGRTCVHGNSALIESDRRPLQVAAAASTSPSWTSCRSSTYASRGRTSTTWRCTRPSRASSTSSRRACRRARLRLSRPRRRATHRRRRLRPLQPLCAQCMSTSRTRSRCSRS